MISDIPFILLTPKTDCSRILAVLTPRFAFSRGSSCTPVILYAVPYAPPVFSSPVSVPVVTSVVSALASEVSLSTVVRTPTPAIVSSAQVLVPTMPPYCVLATYFTILVNETGYPAQYLYDPNSVNDEALSFTLDFSESAIFSLTSTNQLEFHVVNVFNQPVVLISEQDILVFYFSIWIWLSQ